MYKNQLLIYFIAKIKLPFALAILCWVSFYPAFAEAKKISFQHVEPPGWWVDMPDSTLEILVYQNNIAANTFEILSKTDDVKLIHTQTLTNPNYAVLQMHISPHAEPQTFVIKSKGKAGSFSYSYVLQKRFAHRRGLEQSDAIYLITPDRFANGNPKNDSFKDMRQTGINRSEPYARHGGDIQGMIDHLDYIQDLGMTAVWPGPLLENDQPSESYHGYAITNHYQIDKRFGTHADYRTFADNLHKRGMKLIMDVVYNHIGNGHFLYRDIPDSSWFHFWDNYTRTTYRATTLMDPYASEKEREVFSNGWFDKHMPDLNQKNETLARYLIQQTLWWIETYQIDALRIDTYAYPDPDFMVRWAKEVKKAYPDVFLFAETWVHGFTVQGWFKSHLLAKEENHLDGLTDFQIYYAIQEALTTQQGWTEGVSKLYYTLAADYIYERPENMVTFLDNHDVERFYGFLDGDIQKIKAGLALLFTLRGIPSVYYGTEILMRETDGHGKIREDFPGGWSGDSVNKFNRQERSAQENEVFDYIRSLANLRKSNPAIFRGSTTQFVPVDGLYVFFRHVESQWVMVALNTSGKNQKLDLTKYDEILKGQREFYDLNGQKIKPEEVKIEPMEVWVLMSK